MFISPAMHDIRLGKKCPAARDEVHGEQQLLNCVDVHHQDAMEWSQFPRRGPVMPSVDKVWVNDGFDGSNGLRGVSP